MNALQVAAIEDAVYHWTYELLLFARIEAWFPPAFTPHLKGTAVLSLASVIQSVFLGTKDFDGHKL